jgi:hypothetical protein
MIMTKIEREANLYKDLPTKKLKKVIKEYKFLVMANSKNFNFIFTLFCMLLPYFVFFVLSPISLILLISVHYLLFDLYLYEKKSWKLVSDKDRNEMEQILVILENSLKNRETKNPSV